MRSWEEDAAHTFKTCIMITGHCRVKWNDFRDVRWTMFNVMEDPSEVLERSMDSFFEAKTCVTGFVLEGSL